MVICFGKVSSAFCAFVALCSPAFAEDVVVVAKDRALGDALSSSWSQPDPTVLSKFVVEQHGAVKYVFERALIEGDNPGWFATAMKTAGRLAGKKPQRLADLTSDEQDAIRRLVLAGPATRAPYLREAVKNPEFRIGFAAMVKSQFASNGRRVSIYAEFIPERFYEDLETPGLKVPPLGSNARKGVNDNEGEQGYTFVIAEDNGPSRVQTLRRIAYQRLELHKMQVRMKADEQYRLCVGSVLDGIQECGSKWDGKSEVRAADLCPNLAARLESSFAHDFSSMGFDSAESAKGFFRSSTLSNPRVSLMMYWAGQGSGGRHTIGVGLGNIRP